jgi:hypothetical protein
MAMRSPGGRTHSRHSSVCTATCICALLMVPSSASSAQISVYTDLQGTSCFFTHPPLLETMPVFVLLKHSTGHVVASFSLSLPSPSPYSISSWSVPAPALSLGDPESGIQVAFGHCVVGDALIMRLDLMRVADPTTDCLGLRLSGADSWNVSPALVDCSQPVGQVDYVSDSVLWLQGEDGCAPMPEPSEPSPSDGATGVPLNVTLDCKLHDNQVVFTDCVPLHSGRWVNIYFGTDPNPPLAFPMGEFPMPRILAPGTTYYWRVEHHYGPASALSPLWTFTTTNATPVETSTWGRIKAFYRR